MSDTPVRILVLHLFLLLHLSIFILGLGTITWIGVVWSRDQDERGGRPEHTTLLLCSLSVGLVGISRLIDIFRLSEWLTLVKIRAEFVMTGLMTISWIATNGALTLSSLSQRPPSPYLSSPPSSPPSPPLTNTDRFPKTILFLSIAFQTLFFLSSTCLLASGLSALHQATLKGLDVEWVMWDFDVERAASARDVRSLDEETGLLDNVDRVLRGSSMRGREETYGALGTGQDQSHEGLLDGRVEDEVKKFGLEEQDENGRRRVRWVWGLTGLSGGVLIGSSGWAVLGWEGFDKADISLWVLSSITFFLCLSTLFLPSFYIFKPSFLRPSTLRTLLILHIILYPLPTAFFTLPLSSSSSSSPSSEQGDPDGPQSEFSKPILPSPEQVQAAVSALPGFTIACAWAVVGLCLWWLVQETLLPPPSASSSRNEGYDDGGDEEGDDTGGGRRRRNQTRIPPSSP
ncbi:hypothetical protein [Phaffia rhodozyma]|uniref:Uncharacterized protein n=1 Tax=Phaffia rhodozyma TaxID=264483 RepID=A0A0F7SRB6_PHARH|nr:hypothetical protein [Phaffia rhodozyma]